MKAGVATLPCEVINSPALANPSVWSNRKEKLKNHISHKGYTRYAPLSGQWASYVILSESGSRPGELAIQEPSDSNRSDSGSMVSRRSPRTQQ